MATIITKNSSTASAAPASGDLTKGELAVNVTDKKLYTKDNSAAIVKLVGSLGNQEASAVAITGGSIAGITDLAVADGGTGASSAADARTNLGVTATGADTAYAFRSNNLSDLASASTARTNLGLGTIATQAASSVAITGGSVTGITDITVADGGTGASTAANARSNLGLVIGTDVLAPNGSAANLTSFPTLNQNTTGNAATVTTNANLTGAVTSVGNATSLGSFSSANLLGALTDETGTGSAVFATSPTLVTPILGTPTSATLTNATGLPISTGVSGLGTGVATALAVNVGSAGAPVVNGGVLGTPSSGTATNLTGLPLSTGVTGTLPVANGGTGATDAATARTNLAVAGTGVSNTFSANQIISVTDNTNAALRVTQLGTGNALLVEDSANPDSTPFVVTTDGRVVAGTTVSYSAATVTPKYQAHTTSVFDGGFGGGSWEASANPQVTWFTKSRSGTIGTQTIVQADDALGRFSYFGSDGTSFIEAVRIQAAVDGTPGTNDMPGRLVFSTTADGASAPTERVRIASTGAIGLSGANYGTSGQVLTSGGSGATPTWTTVSGTGDVVGPASATDNAFARFDSTTGKLLQNSTGATLSDTGGATFTGSVDVAGTSTAGSNIKLYEDTDNGTNYVSFKAPDTIAANVTWTLPAADGTSAQVLSTNGSGTLSWATAGGGGGSSAGPTTEGIVYGKTDATSLAFLGYQAGASTTGIRNTLIGFKAGFSNVTGTNNVIIGFAAGENTTGSDNTFVGSRGSGAGGGAGNAVTSGSRHTLIGQYDGNQDGLDIRTATNYAVISDGAGNRLISTANGQTLALDSAVPNSGTGITFPATQSASSDANTLDDYEEGTWTPLLAFGGSSSGITYDSGSRGNYTKIGNVVHVFCRMVLTSKGSQTSTATITGLPFTSLAGVHVAGCSIAAFTDLTFANQLIMSVLDSTTTVFIQEVTEAGVRTDLNNNDFTNSTRLSWSCTYLI